MTDRIIDIIEDYACLSAALTQIVYAMKHDGVGMPVLPVLNDAFVSDHLGIICEYLSKLKKK